MIGIGHIGVGTMARGRAARLLERDDVRVVIGWSRGAADLAEYVGLTGAAGTRDWSEVIDHPDVRAVCIATPTATHVDYALAALEAGKHVLVECPAAGDVAELGRMVNAARRNGVVFYAGSNYRLDAIAAAFAHAATRVGDVLVAQGDSTWLPGGRGWYLDCPLSGGLFPCVHLYQFTVFEPLGRALWVDATMSRDGRHGTAIVRYESGAAGVATGGFQPHGTNEFVLVGTEGILRKQPDGAFAIERSDGAEAVPAAAVDVTAEDNACFLRCIEGNEDWELHAERERTIHAAAIAAQISAERGERVLL